MESSNGRGESGVLMWDLDEKWLSRIDQHKRVQIKFIRGNYARLTFELMRTVAMARRKNQQRWRILCCFSWFAVLSAFFCQCSIPIIAVCHGLVDSKVGCRDTSVCIALHHAWYKCIFVYFIWCVMLSSKIEFYTFWSYAVFVCQTGSIHSRNCN